MIHAKDYGYVFISDLGIEYELLEGMSIGAEKRYTSDIIFIMLMDANYDVDTNCVGYLFGATILDSHIDSYQETIKSLIADYEKRNNITKRIVEK